MLLGQAESGKSTLQKQFQLYYASKTLDHERPLWQPVVYFNIIKAIRMILNELDYEFAPKATSASSTPSEIVVINDAESGNNESLEDASIHAEVSLIRQKLLTLTAIEDTLASELNGGVSITGSRRGVYVRAGWLSTSLSSSNSRSANTNLSTTTTLAAKSLLANQDNIEELWRHPAVKSLLRLRRLRLEDSAS